MITLTLPLDNADALMRGSDLLVGLAKDARMKGVEPLVRGYGGTDKTLHNVMDDGEPKLMVTVEGHRVYDPRDPHQSLEDPGTWKASDNAALCAAHLLQPALSPGAIDWIRVGEVASQCDQSAPVGIGPWPPMPAVPLSDCPVSTVSLSGQSDTTFDRALGGPIASGVSYRVSEPVAQDFDTDGLPWDERIHASTKTTTQDGRWKKKRGVDADLVMAVESELRNRGDDRYETLVEDMAAAATPPPPPPPPPPAPSAEPITFADLIKGITENQINPDTVLKAIQSVGLANAGELFNRPDLIPQVARELGLES